VEGNLPNTALLRIEMLTLLWLSQEQQNPDVTVMAPLALNEIKPVK